MTLHKSFLLISFIFILFGYDHAQEKPPSEEKTRILFVLDASQSMLGNWESGRKIDIAREMLIQMVDSLNRIESVELALRVYGHQKPVPPQNCDDTKLEVPFAPGLLNDQELLALC